MRGQRTLPYGRGSDGASRSSTSMSHTLIVWHNLRWGRRGALRGRLPTDTADLRPAFRQFHPEARFAVVGFLSVDLSRHPIEHGAVEFHAQAGFRRSVHVAILGDAELVFHVRAVARSLRHRHLEPD